jgi:hypothetical protein
MKKLSETSNSIQIRVVLTEEQREFLDSMAGVNNRSAFVRKLICQEYKRRQRRIRR